MAVVIRLKRLGTKKKPAQRIVVIDKRLARDGKVIEEIGAYDPSYNPPRLTIKQDRAKYWIGKGAVPSQTVKNLLRKQGAA